MITVLSTTWCGPCKNLKAWLEKQDYEYEIRDVEKDKEARELLGTMPMTTVPCILVDGKHFSSGFGPLVAKKIEEHYADETSA